MRQAPRSILALSLLAAAVCLQAQVIDWESDTHDFGIFHEADGHATARFILHNTGAAPVHILEARSTCGCTRPDFSGKAIMPGDTAMVTVSYDPAGRPGRFSKKVYVDMDTDPPRHTLLVKGTVIGSEQSVKTRYPESFGPLRLRDKMMTFGTFNNHEVRSAYIEAYNASSDTLRPRFADIPRHIHILVSPEVMAPGEQAVFSATIYGEKAPDFGFMSDSVTLRPDPLADTAYSIPVTAVIEEDFSGLSPKDLDNAPIADLSAEVIDLGRLKSSDGPLTASVSLTNNGKNPLIVRRIYADDEAVGITPLKSSRLKKGKSAEITVSVDPSQLAGRQLLNSRITLITNDPGHPTHIIRVIAEMD